MTGTLRESDGSTDKVVQESMTLNEPRPNPELALSPASMIENLQPDQAVISTCDSLSPQQVVQTPSDVAEMTGNFLDMITSSEWSDPYIQDVAMGDSTTTKKQEWKHLGPKSKKNAKKNSKNDKAEATIEPTKRILGNMKSKARAMSLGQRCKFCDLVHPRAIGDVRAGVSTCPFVRFLHSIWGEQFEFHTRDGKPGIRFAGRSKKSDNHEVPMFHHKEPLVSWIRLEFEMNHEEDPSIHEQPMRSLAEQLGALSRSCNVQGEDWSNQKIRDARELYDECAKVTKAQMDRWASTLAVRGHGAVRQQHCRHDPRCGYCGKNRGALMETRLPARRGPPAHRGSSHWVPLGNPQAATPWRPRNPGFQHRTSSYPYPYGQNFRG
ncbi:hypothetical protein A1Q2_02284 [Trichosporon asahii var. asahii CBS 8904]|uniref:Uncharacterized protein n=1 Tax=Trichosporon asahii var. asahii (strain CBS 8904) TaxID=1220162 RepID=K1VS42_TRIAC|nr:hypothetical protein A1Q2_02284 [Trichosporon asahii var. asahii CBS 8904]